MTALPGGWPALLARIARQQRQLRVARLLFRWLRLDEVEPIGIGEYAVAFGYVALSNDLRAAWASDLTDVERDALANALRSADYMNWSADELAVRIAGTVRAIAAGRLR